MDRYICIHGHFYQPPRENPWLETVELQDSAYPYHDWNARVAAECYAPNTAARILDGAGRIRQIVNTYARISFNIGPTLLAWMRDARPDLYRAIQQADQESQRRFGGHGSAIAQVYNHMIMPLANRRDKRTQVRWGIRDFTRHFGRRPEGMWLAETAVDLETLDILAEEGIRFTILAPHQAARVRALAGGGWQDVSGSRIDPSMAYQLRLPSGRTMVLFFYDGPIAQAVAFEHLLDDGQHFARRLLDGFDDRRGHPQLMHIATDGETYGHHHPHGDMALAYALRTIESSGAAHLTNYGEFLERHPPTHEVAIIERTSWSCSHGIRRWEADCGCNSGGYPGWNQGWRAPLRAALDWLRDELAPHFEQYVGDLVRDPWAARDDYIDVILERAPERLAAFVERHAVRRLDEDERVALLELLEIQRHAMLMYTSCGWFFDELSGVETVQVILYAARALQLAEERFGLEIEPRFLELLERARSNLPEHRDGRTIYEKWVRPAMVGWETIGAHYAVSALFEEYPDRARIFCYTVAREEFAIRALGRARLVLGRAVFTSEITSASRRLSFGVLHFGDHTISGGVRVYQGQPAYQALTQAITDAFDRADYPEVIRCLDRSFGESTYSLRSLFRDEQRRCLDQIMAATMAEHEATYRQLYDRDAALMRFLASLQAPIPPAFLAAAAFVIDIDLRRAFAADLPDARHVQARIEEAAMWNIALDTAGLGYILQQTLARLARRFEADPVDMDAFTALRTTVDLARTLPFEVDLWEAQNSYHDMLRLRYPAVLARATQGDAAARAWLGDFVTLGEGLQFRVNQMHMKEITAMTSIDEIIREIVTHRHIPRATYRLQINPDFTLHDAAALVAYLDTLGVSDIYASPMLRARPGSSHGYDIADHSQVNPEIGGQAAFDTLASALAQRGMSLILDTVPNHMGIGTVENSWWMDVLENGPGSIYADYFDIDWQPLNPDLAGKVLLPILEDQYGTVLEQGKLRLGYEDGAFFLRYWEHVLPVAPRSYRLILEAVLDSIFGSLGIDNEYVLELQSIMTAIGYLPPRMRITPEQVIERNREKQIIKRRLAALHESSSEVQTGIATSLVGFNGDVADPQSFDLLDRLIDAQAYRLAYWRVATEEINYRRFFDINDLAAIRVEVPEVFDATHEVLLQLLADGKARGLRIDHIDGLFDPATYLQQLQRRFLRRVIAARLHDQNGDGGTANGESVDDAVIDAHVTAWIDQQAALGECDTKWPLYVVVEKILAKNETLPPTWATDGTSGYDFLNAVGGLFVDGASQAAFDALYHALNPSGRDFRELENASKKMIMLISLASEINELSYQIERMAERTRRYRDFTLASLTFALREIIACLPVYRTYIAGPDHVLSGDMAAIEAAVTAAKRRNPRTAHSIFDFLCDTLLLRNLHDFHSEDRERLVELVMTFQQVTGPVMAKGVEDTAFYIYNRLVSLNEVGGHPQRFGTTTEKFHEQNIQRLERWPHALLATSTHDTKRSEDVRARINVLSEMPEAWHEAVARWGMMNADKKIEVDGQPAPDQNDEYLLYQTLIGAWPIEPYDDAVFAQFCERVAAYMHKATKEAKVHTSWINANEEYDAAVRQFVHALLSKQRDDPFRADIEAFQRRTSYHGRFNSLAQTLLKLTAPGVPDLYQGTELWDLSLVDPDNRRSVDYGRRQALLKTLHRQIGTQKPDQRALVRELLGHAHDGRIKLFLIERALGLRRTMPDLFAHGTYLPLEANGQHRDHLCAFTRTHGTQEIIVIVPRLMLRLTEGREQPPIGDIWAETWLALPERLPGRQFRNRFTGALISAQADGPAAQIALAVALRDFPVALLERADG